MRHAGNGTSAMQHDDEEWEAMYPHIDRKYRMERNTLRQVMFYMDRVHGFKATCD